MGGNVEYDVPIMKVQEYSLEDIFSKNLLLLIPFEQNRCAMAC